MKRLLILTMTVLLSAISMNAKTLVVYYSYTNNVHRIVTDLLTQIDADAIRVEPAEKDLKYEANNYAIGSALISAIRNNPDDASSYPAIDPVDVNMSDYDMIIVAAPLWWSQMAAPLQTFLFQYGKLMAGKNIGVIVSSASSGVSGVVADAKRLIPEGNFLEKDLWIRSSQVSNCHSLISTWLSDINYNNISLGIGSVKSDDALSQVSITSDGISVSGDFDNLAVYDANGKKLLDTTHTHTPYQFQSGYYVALLKKGYNVNAIKLAHNRCMR